MLNAKATCTNRDSRFGLARLVLAALVHRGIFRAQ
jgi:hypothetical protein